MIAMSVEFPTVDQVAAYYRSVGMNAQGRVMRVLYTQLQRTLTKAIGYTPIETGALRGSGRIEIGPDSVAIIFGGRGAVSYAVYVHEILTNVHPVGQAKYLERAVVEDQARIMQALSKALGT